LERGEYRDPVLDRGRSRRGVLARPVLCRLPPGGGVRRYAPLTGAPVSWVEGRRFLVAGTGVAGRAAAGIPLAGGAVVTVLDRRASDVTAELGTAGAAIVLGDLPPADVFDHVDDVVVSPGFPPDAPLVRAAGAAGLRVYSEPELAWRLRGPGAPA